MRVNALSFSLHLTRLFGAVSCLENVNRKRILVGEVALQTKIKFPICSFVLKKNLK